VAASANGQEEVETGPISLKEAEKSEKHQAVIVSYNLKYGNNVLSSFIMINLEFFFFPPRTKETEQLFEMKYCQSLQVAPEGDYLLALSSNHFLLYDLETKKHHKFVFLTSSPGH